MSFRNSLAIGAAALALVPAMVIEAQAQQITSAIRGTVTDTSGAPVSGADVIIVHTPTGSASTSTTNSAGVFSARNLRIGGPYTVTVTADGFQPTAAEDITLSLGDTFDLSLALPPAESADVVVVTGQALNVVQTAVGPSATFNQRVLETAPAVNRSITDVVRLDARVLVNEGNNNSIQCAGANPRYNSLTLDGVRMNDSFGLNSNGFPTERQPFSYDAIEQVAVELAPFDVQYGGFSACAINAVTKSGGNEFHGGAFYDYTDEGLTGSSLEGNSISQNPFDEQRYGVHVGGPIWKDKIFFFVAYEKQDASNTFNNGYEGSGAANELEEFTQADYQEIIDIAQSLYNYNPGAIATSFPNEDEKLLVKLDWDITNNHRASFIYNYNDGFNISASDDASNEFEYSNHFYERGAELNSYTGSLYSDWTDSFSTEFRVSYLQLDNRQNSIGQDGFGEMRIEVGDNDIYIGEDDSRQSNKLNYDSLSFIGRGTYVTGNHAFTFGYEREELDVFNLFVQHTIGEYRFGSIDDFRAGTPYAIYYNNSPTLDPDNAAASFGYATNALYLQDEYDFGNGLTVTAGLRYDWYESDDVPAENPGFTEAFGFPNTATFDGKDLLQPRFGFQWDATDTVTVRGGFGLYSGGNPNVWLANSYQNNNVLQFGQRGRNFGYTNGSRTLFDDDVVYPAGMGPGYSVPAELIEAVQAGEGANFEINYIDPDFTIPSEWKVALGATWLADLPVPVIGGEYTLNADFLYSWDNSPPMVLRGDLMVSDTRLVGLELYDGGDLPAAFVLTNSERHPTSTSLSFSVQKEYDFGLDWMLSYAHNDANDVQPMNSSVAFSNFTYRAFRNPQEDVSATSDYLIDDRFSFLANYEHEFIKDWATRFSIFGLAQSGRKFSYTITNENQLFNFDPYQDADQVLLYVPTGPDDPLVTYADGFDQAAFINFLADAQLGEFAGGFAGRNAHEAGWWTKFDLRVEQEVPGILDGHSASVFLIIDNVGNLLNDEWGILRTPDNVKGVVDAAVINGGTQFEYQEFNQNILDDSIDGGASLWSIRIGARYDF